MSRQWVSHQLGILPDKMDADRLLILTIKLREHKATIEDKQEIIKGHLKLMIVILGKIVRSTKTLKEDMLGEAALAITEAVHDAEYRLTDNNITAYIVSSMIYKVKNAITKYPTMGMPVRTLRYKIARGINKDSLFPHFQDEIKNICSENLKELEKIPEDLQRQLLEQAKTLNPTTFKNVIKSTIVDQLKLPKREAVVVSDDEFANSNNNKPFDCTSERIFIPQAKYDMPSVEFMEILSKTTETPMQRAIMKMRMEGHTYKEIGETVGYSTVRVGEIVNEMEQRFDYYWKL